MNWADPGSVSVFDGDFGSNGTSNIAFAGTYQAPVQSTSIVRVSDAGTVVLHNSSDGPVDVRLAAQGWFSPPAEQWDDSDGSDLQSSPQLQYLVPAKLITSASQAATVELAPTLPAGKSFTATSDGVGVTDGSGILGTYRPVSTDGDGAVLPISLALADGKLMATVTRPTDVTYPIVIQAPFIPVGAGDGDETVQTLVDAAEADAQVSDEGTSTDVDPNAGEVDENNFVLPATGEPVLDDESTSGETRMFARTSSSSSSSSSTKVEVPSNYKYHPDRGPRVTLHDYCSHSPDKYGDATFRGPCARHDMCYEKIYFGSSMTKSTCSKWLYRNMAQNCRYAYGKWNPLRWTCYSVAGEYYGAVQAWTLLPGK